MMLLPSRFVSACLTTMLLLACTLSASTVTLSPTKPVAGQPVTVTYDKTGGPLASSANIRIHHGINGWQPVARPDPKMTVDGTGKYTYTFLVPEQAYALNMAFNSVESPTTWDNNGGTDFNFDAAPAPIPDEVPAGAALPSNASRARVMMQGFYWDVPAGGTWYDVLASKAQVLRNMRGGHGIDRIWFPPASKSQSGAFSMGYDPFDYYDLGAYNQKGTVAVRFGTQAQLKAAIAVMKAQGISVMADIVPNHRSGGDSEMNGNSNVSTYTDFTKVLSGKATWRFDQFHPSTYAFADASAFGDFADVALDLSTPNTAGWPRYDLIEWANWLKDPANAGFDGGWRFDFVMGYRPSFISEFRKGTGNAFGILENWDRSVTNLDAMVKYSGGTMTFDFAAYYTLRDALNFPSTGDLRTWIDPNLVYAARNPSKAVTFCANHDTDEIASNKMLGYAFILTYEGYPCLFWRDYFDRGLATLGGQEGNGIDALVWVRGALAGGQPSIEVLKADAKDALVYGTKNGTSPVPGYIAGFNLSGAAQTVSVKTSNPALKGKVLRSYAWYSYAAGGNVQPAEATASADGTVSIRIPPLGYVVYGPADYNPNTPTEAPSITVEPIGQTVSAGTTVFLTVSAKGQPLSYQWRKNGVPVAGADADTLTLPSVTSAQSGSYTVRVSNAAGEVTSADAIVTVGVVPVSNSSSRISNISTRSLVGTGARAQIAGFVIAGSDSRPLVIRAAGPGLGAFGLTGLLVDPMVELNDGKAVITSNDNWEASLASWFTAVGAWGWTSGSKDAAINASPNPGSYTAIVSGKNGGTGVALVEVFDAALASTVSRLTNISTRSLVGTGSDVQIAGFVISGTQPKTVLIRATGPMLRDFGISDALEDPIVELYTASQLKLASNDNWDASLAPVSASVGAFAWPSGSKEAAILTTLEPGGYTAVVSGKNNGTGVALIEVYEVN